MYHIKRKVLITQVYKTLVLLKLMQIIQKKGNMKMYFVMSIY